MKQEDQPGEDVVPGKVPGSVPGSLEHADTKESFRQLWWTIGVTVIGLAVIAYVYL